MPGCRTSTQRSSLPPVSFFELPQNMCGNNSSTRTMAVREEKLASSEDERHEEDVESSASVSTVTNGTSTDQQSRFSELSHGRVESRRSKRNVLTAVALIAIGNGVATYTVVREGELRNFSAEVCPTTHHQNERWIQSVLTSSRFSFMASQMRSLNLFTIKPEQR